jgi:hypothetical protein
MTMTKATSLAAVDLGEFYVHSIVGHKRMGANPKRWTYRERWLGYEEGDDT